MHTKSSLLAIAILCFLINNNLLGQQISGQIRNNEDRSPIGFVNIGVIGKNIGTVSTSNGQFSFYLTPEADNDSIRISCVGFNPLIVKVSDFRRKNGETIFLNRREQNLSEIIVKPRYFKTKTLGITSDSKSFGIGFQNNELGYECGVLMKNKKEAFLRQVNININSCTYDTIFYRLNVYRQGENQDFENILTQPIYFKIPKEEIKNQISLDISRYNVVTKGNFLVTLEHVKNIGKGQLLFCVGMFKDTYYRKTSQGEWKTIPAGVSISVVAEVEK